MASEIQSRVWDDSKQCGVHLLALLAITDRADPVTGMALITVADLQRLVRVSADEANQILADLVEDGEITTRIQHSLVHGDCYFVRAMRYQRFGYDGVVIPMFPAKRNGSKIAPTTRQYIMERDIYRCRYCGTHHSLSVDHVMPSSRGGGDNTENLVTCCLWCNSRKGNRTPEEAGMILQPAYDTQMDCGSDVPGALLR